MKRNIFPTVTGKAKGMNEWIVTAKKFVSLALIVALKKAVVYEDVSCLPAAGVFGDCLRSFTDSVLCQFSREN